MRNTSEIRKANRFCIMQILAGGKEYSVAEMSKETGFCVATCNTILRDLAEKGEAIGEKRQLNEVGRASIIYRINAEYKSSLYILQEKTNEITIYVAYAYGGQRAYSQEKINYYNEETVIEFIKKYRNDYPNIADIYVTAPYGESARWQERFEKLFSENVYVKSTYEVALKGYDVLTNSKHKFVGIVEKMEGEYLLTLLVDGVVVYNEERKRYTKEELKNALSVLHELFTECKMLYVGEELPFSLAYLHKEEKFFGNLLRGALTFRA